MKKLVENIVREESSVTGINASIIYRIRGQFEERAYNIHRIDGHGHFNGTHGTRGGGLG
jgi:hypothetical protein